MLVCIDFHGKIQSLGIKNGNLYIGFLNDSFYSGNLSVLYLIPISDKCWLTPDKKIVLDVYGDFSYDNRGRIVRMGNIPLEYSNKNYDSGSLAQVGPNIVYYTSNGKYASNGEITSFGGFGIRYHGYGNIAGIGSTMVTYDADGTMQSVGFKHIQWGSDGKVQSVGGVAIERGGPEWVKVGQYNYRVKRIIKIGDTSISYLSDGKISRIGGATLGYYADGRVSKVGSTSINLSSDGKILSLR